MTASDCSWMLRATLPDEAVKSILDIQEEAPMRASNGSEVLLKSPHELICEVTAAVLDPPKLPRPQSCSDLLQDFPSHRFAGDFGQGVCEENCSAVIAFCDFA